MKETAFTFDCNNSPLLGILHAPEKPGITGVLMIVGGGPQYRAGGHRQLLLWARKLASEGYPVMRFDYRGMGESGGIFQGFEHTEDDLKAAIECFMRRSPEIKNLILWGECDASSAIMMHAAKDTRIKGISLQNPWLRSESGEAKTYLKHYYLHRLTQPSFWKKVFSFEFNPLTALGSLAKLVRKAIGTPADASQTESPSTPQLPYPERMKQGMQQYQGKTLLFLSGRDLIAKEFEEAVKADSDWDSLINNDRVTRIDIPLGDHTFSSNNLRNEVINHGLSWLKTHW